MGVTIGAPKPELSNDMIPRFNAVLENSESVFPQEEQKFLPEVEGSSGDWLPLDNRSVGQWKDVIDAWRKLELGVGSAQDSVNVWAKVLGWGELNGEVPEGLLGRFGDLYIEAPLLGRPVESVEEVAVPELPPDSYATRENMMRTDVVLVSIRRYYTIYDILATLWNF